MSHIHSYAIIRKISQSLLLVFMVLGSNFWIPSALADGETIVTVTEEIPGMDCSADDSAGTGPEHKRYKCVIQPGFGSVILILRGLIKYVTFITALVGVLMLVVSGVQYSIAGADKSAAEAAKKRIEKVLAGITLLFLIGFVLNSVAPWVYR